MSLQLNNIHFSYARKKSLYASFSATLQKGYITALLGTNGSGKTSLLKLCCGLLVPDKGAVEADGYKVSSRHSKAMEQLFYVPDSLSLPNTTAAQYARITGCFYKDYDSVCYTKLLERFQVPANKTMGDLSFGQQKKVGLALAFAVNTPYLLLDEPTNGLDPQSMDTLKQIIAESAHEERSIVISTHHLRDVENLCDDLMVLDNEHRLTHQSVQSILKKYHFGTSETAPEDSIYSETTFSHTCYISPFKQQATDSQFNLSLYMNAVISGSLNQKQ